MTVTIPTTLQPISESPERRSASSNPTRTPDLRFVRGHTRRRSAPPTDPTLDPATALVLAQARLSAAQAEMTLQRTAADGLRVANAQLRAQNVELEERVRELEALLSSPQPLTPTTSTGTESSASDDISAPDYRYRHLVDPTDNRSPSTPSTLSTGGASLGGELEDPATALWKVYADLRSAEARMDTVYTYLRTNRNPVDIRDTHCPLFSALERLQATFARRPR